MQALWTFIAKIGEWLDFSWKTNLYFAETSACVSFIKVSVDNYTSCGKIRKDQLLRLFCGNGNLIGGLCQEFQIRVTCLDIQIRFFQNHPLNFWYPGPNWRLCVCRAWPNNNMLKAFPTLATFGTEKKTGRCLSFRFSLRIKPFALQNYWLHFVVEVLIDYFLILNGCSAVKNCIFFLETEIWRKKLAKNWIRVWFVLIFKLGFPQRNCKNFVRHSLNNCVFLQDDLGFSSSFFMFSNIWWP